MKDIDRLENWPERVKQMQRNWIGKSKGAEFTFNTVRMDTLLMASIVELCILHIDIIQDNGAYQGIYQ